MNDKKFDLLIDHLQDMSIWTKLQVIECKEAGMDTASEIYQTKHESYEGALSVARVISEAYGSQQDDKSDE